MSYYIDLASPDYFHNWKRLEKTKFKEETTPKRPPTPKTPLIGYILIAIGVALILFPKHAKADILSSDKLDHVIVSGALTGLSYCWWRAVRLPPVAAYLLSVTTVATVGIAHELYQPGGDYQDVIANGVGIGLVSIPIIALDF